jgi:hypothetical protein
MIVPLAGSRSGGKHETGARVSAGDATRVLGQSGDAAMGYNAGTPRTRPSRESNLTLWALSLESFGGDGQWARRGPGGYGSMVKGCSPRIIIHHLPS